MAKGYPPEFRRRVLDLLAAGRKVANIARDLGISDQTIYNWRKQDRIDRGLEPGLTSTELEELAKARRRIAELEAEVAAMKRSQELLKELVPPGSERRTWSVEVGTPPVDLTYAPLRLAVSSDEGRTASMA